MHKKMILTILLIILSVYSNYAQISYLPQHNPGVDSFTYNFNLNRLKILYSSPEVKTLDDFHNINIMLAKLKAPNDTVQKVFDVLIQKFGIDYCDRLLNDREWGVVVKPIFNPIYKNEWNDLCKKCNAIYKNLDSNLIRKLLQLDSLDQKYRGNPSHTNMDMVLQMKLDSNNRMEIDSLISVYGYIGKNKVGNKFKDICWEIINHGPIPYQKKYLDLLKAVSNSEEMTKSNIAYTIDRIMLAELGVQKYGTQFYFDEKTKTNRISPLEDEAQVDKFRREMYLISLKYYLERINKHYEN